MRSTIILTSIVLAVTCHATELLDRNLAYMSPFVGFNEFSHDTRAIQAHHIRHAKRQMIDSTGLSDEHYPTFYGGDFSNSPFVWGGGVNFTHSVASGDPFDTSVLLWTRAVPLQDDTGSLPDQSVPVCVSWKIFDNSQLSGRPINSGEAFTSYDVDFTVKVEATKLKADTHYWYQFSDCSHPTTVSPVGATRTISNPNTPAHLVNGGKPLTLAVFSCSQFQNGWFNAYGVAAHNTSADIFVHLGDYIYEQPGNGARIGRVTLGRELATLADYRQRLNQYRTDTSLVAAHQAAPWITVWVCLGDGKITIHLLTSTSIADNAWKAGTADSNDTAVGCKFSPSGACFTDRKLAGVRAYHEWMPIRQVAVDDKLRIWRNFQIGKLLASIRDIASHGYQGLNLTVSFSGLDYARYSLDPDSALVINSLADFQNRSLMGAAQEQWFYHTLSQSKSRGAVWRVVGQQIVFTQLNESGFDVDAWDGYRANRARVLGHLYDNKISNTLILSGDSHANWVSDLARPNDTTTYVTLFVNSSSTSSGSTHSRFYNYNGPPSYDPVSGRGAIGVEFAGTAVTSGSPFGSAAASPTLADTRSQLYVSVNADLQWSEGYYRGFFTLKLDPNNAFASYYAMRNTSTANLDSFISANFTVKAGANKLTRPVAGGQVLAGALKSGIQTAGGSE
ncbi:hypothetical protein NLI96_g25 [Meripilus lineatus]|uniref:Alkaline phosphatase n=1 Tax=Meripilus lineatus TaxID=2056292 RepID=A0AAD5VEF0_9APHY|nr:hypothetical protein NLI96_g25 [Physisporinus lineatus]